MGHVYRDYHPYKFPNGTGNTINRWVCGSLKCWITQRHAHSNLNRVAEVWMDEYKDIYYKFKPSQKAAGELRS